MKGFIVVLMILLGNSILFSQYSHRHTTSTRSELGPLIGGSYYLGDLNNKNPFIKNHLALGVIYRFQLNPRFTWRNTLMYGKVSGDDSWSKSDLQYNRNLTFESKIFEFASGFEVNYFPFQIGHDRFKGTAFLFGGLGLFGMNPQTTINGTTYDLRKYGTEGQGTSLNSNKRYSLVQFCVPLGVGARLSLWRFGSISLEYGIRKTFTDYIDDVHAENYVDPVLLANESDMKETIMLSNRSIDGNFKGKRGTEITKDWYGFYMVMITFKLGKHNPCPSAN